MAFTNEEILRSNESYTKKDFIQIYKEIIDIAGKISERWDPTATNESDPMIVLMKTLAFVGDKNNYYIDKRTLENFMPSVTQLDNMRRLCDLFGYNAKYIQSGETTLSMTYIGSDLTTSGDYIYVPSYTQITNEDKNVTYTTLEAATFTSKGQLRTVKCIQGVLQKVNTDNVNDSVITMNNLDDNLRFYLPISRLSENGIIVTSYQGAEVWGVEWTKVDNLNEYPYESKVWKFGYDSNKKCPYLQFPKDIATIIGDGLYVTYFTTDGVEGNVSARTLTKFVNDSIYLNGSSSALPQVDDNGNERMKIFNAYAVTNGSEEESIDTIYNNYKKTVGTFDTLVTCRDYMNKIYQLTNDNGRYLVGNIDVGDKRTDVNKSVSILTFDSFGIHYNTQSTGTVNTEDISCFDIYLYPLNYIGDSVTAKTYAESFKPNTTNHYKIESELENYKTLCHNIKYVSTSDIYMYKDYYSLNAKVVTMNKVNSEEQQSILNNIYSALMKAFHSRNVDLGTEITYDSILKVMEQSDERIKFVSLDEPEHSIKVMNGAGNDQDLTAETSTGIRDNYITEIAKNVLAGRVDLFKYEEDVTVKYGQYNSSVVPSDYPTHKITSIQPKFTIGTLTSGQDTTLNYKLRSNEMIQCISPKLTGDVDVVDGSSATFVYTVNYYWKKNDSQNVSANTTYRLVSGDELYVNWTNADSQAISVKYYVSGTSYLYDKYINNVLSVSGGTWSGYICPNFELRPSYDTVQVPSKKCDVGTTVYGELPSAWNNCMPTQRSVAGTQPQGMGSFSYSDELQIQKIAETKFIDNRNLYWLLNNKNNTIQWSVTSGVGTYILEDGEYVMMTDEGKNDLVIFSAGTKLDTTYYPSDSTYWTIDLNNENKVNLEDVTNYGLGAFSDTNWKYMKFTSSNYFTVTETNILNLVENDTVNKVQVTGTELNNTFITLTKLEYNTTEKIESTTGIQWQIRTRLIMNVGPSISQTLLADSIITGSIQSKQMLGYKYGTTAQTPISNTTINTNYSVYSILDDISVKTVSITGEETDVDDFKIFSYTYVEPKYYNDETTPQATDPCLADVFDNNHYKLEFKDSAQPTSDRHSAHLNVPKVSTTDTGLIMIYYKPSQGTIATAPTVTCSGSNLKEFYSTSSAVSSITLTEGMNIIKIDVVNCSEIIINCNSDVDGTYILSKFKIIKTGTILDETTAYNTVFGLLTNEPAALKTKLQTTLDFNHKFYYGATLDKQLAINIDKTSEHLSDYKFVYDNNNIICRHLIPELDVNSFKYITISRNCQK